MWIYFYVVKLVSFNVDCKTNWICKPKIKFYLFLSISSMLQEGVTTLLEFVQVEHWDLEINDGWYEHATVFSNILVPDTNSTFIGQINCSIVSPGGNSIKVNPEASLLNEVFIEFETEFFNKITTWWSVSGNLTKLNE